MKKLFGNPKMFIEAKQSGRTGHVWILEILIFILVFLVASFAESLPSSIASIVAVYSGNMDFLMQIFQSEGPAAFYVAALSLFEEVSSAAWMNILGLFSTVIATVVAIIYCTKFEKRTVASMGFRKRNWFLEYLIGAAIGIVSITLASVLGMVSGAYTITMASPNFLWLGLFLAGFILQGMSEEVLCRGYLMVSMSRRTPLWICAVLTSVLFALMHFANPGFGLIPFINLFLSGLSFAAIIIKRGSIWAACAMHTFWNFYQGPVFGISVSGTGCTEGSVFTAVAADNLNLWTGGAFGIEGGLCVTIAEVLTLIFILFILPKSKEEQYVEPAPAKERFTDEDIEIIIEDEEVAAAPVETAAETPVVVAAEPANDAPAEAPTPVVANTVPDAPKRDVSLSADVTPSPVDQSNTVPDATPKEDCIDLTESFK